MGRLALFVCALGGILTLGNGTELQAAPITRHFSGVLTNVPEANPLSLVEGAAIAGHVTWDPDSLEEYPFSLPQAGPDNLRIYTKAMPIGPNELVVTVGGVLVPQMSNEQFFAGLFNDLRTTLSQIYPYSQPDDAVFFARSDSRFIPEDDVIPAAGFLSTSLQFVSKDLTLVDGVLPANLTQVDRFEQGQYSLIVAVSQSEAYEYSGVIQLHSVPEPHSAAILVLGLACSAILFVRRTFRLRRA